MPVRACVRACVLLAILGTHRLCPVFQLLNAYALGHPLRAKLRTQRL